MSVGAVCDPSVFDGLVETGPDVLGPRHGSVSVDIAGSDAEPLPSQMTHVFRRAAHPSVVIVLS